MIKKNRNIIVVSVVVVSLLIALFLIMKNTQYKPSKAIAVARNFMVAMKNGQIKKAYNLTDKKAGVGNTLKKFDKKIDKEWRGHGGKPTSNLKVRELFPFQSCFNRFKRTILGQKVDMDIINVDFWAGKIPFAVRLRSDKKGDWVVVYFESHAL